VFRIIKGRKRFTLVDTFGLLMMVKVMAASVPEREGAKKVFEKMRERLKRVTGSVMRLCQSS